MMSGSSPAKGEGPFFDLSSGSISKPRVGVSACLMGEPVRYDGADKYNATVAERLAESFDLRPLCPEADAGLGVPRPAVRLVRVEGRLRALGVDEGGLDVTVDLERFSSKIIARLDVAGFILKSRSPSCGKIDTAIHDMDGRVIGQGSGLFVHALRHAFPFLPLEDERVLENEGAREGFVDRVYLYAAWRHLVAAASDRAIMGTWSPHEYLHACHAHHARRLMKRAPDVGERLARIVEQADRAGLKASLQGYAEVIREVLVEHV